MVQKLIPFARRILRFIVPSYAMWRIYSIVTTRCQTPAPGIHITVITDPAVFNSPEVPEEIRRANCHRPGAIGYAAWRDDKMIGVCWFWPGPLLGGRSVGILTADCAEVIQITVAESARGQGVAPALINYAGFALRGLGYQRLYAQIWITNAASQRSFEKCGWDHVAWSFEFCPRPLSKPIRFRRILPGFRSDRSILSNWRAAAVPVAAPHLPSQR